MGVEQTSEATGSTTGSGGVEWGGASSSRRSVAGGWSCTAQPCSPPPSSGGMASSPARGSVPRGSQLSRRRSLPARRDEGQDGERSGGCFGMFTGQKNTWHDTYLMQPAYQLVPSLFQANRQYSTQNDYNQKNILNHLLLSKQLTR
jgi:hypothetical protein